MLNVSSVTMFATRRVRVNGKWTEKNTRGINVRRSKTVDNQFIANSWGVNFVLAEFKVKGTDAANKIAISSINNIQKDKWNELDVETNKKRIANAENYLNKILNGMSYPKFVELFEAEMEKAIADRNSEKGLERARKQAESRIKSANKFAKEVTDAINEYNNGTSEEELEEAV